MKLEAILKNIKGQWFFRQSNPCKVFTIYNNYIVTEDSTGEVLKVVLSVDDYKADDWEYVGNEEHVKYFGFVKAIELVQEGHLITRKYFEGDKFLYQEPSGKIVLVQGVSKKPFKPTLEDVKATDWHIKSTVDKSNMDDMSDIMEKHLSFSEALVYAKKKFPIYRRAWSYSLFKFLYVENGILLVTTKSGPMPYVLLNDDIMADDWVVIPF